MPARVVVGIDGSAHAWKALDWAAAYARAHRLPLLLMHASRALRSGPGLPESAREHLAAERTDMLNEARRYALKQFPEVEIGVRLSEDDPGSALVAESEQAALVVVGSRGQGGFEGLLFGSVGLHVAGHARCPVLVVPRTAPYPADAPDAIVVGIEGRHPEEHVIGWAFEHAALTGARLIALHAVGGEFGSPYQRLVEDMELAEALAGWTRQYPDVRVVPRVADATAPRALVTESRHAGLVVMGAHQRRGRIGLALGRVNHAVLLHAACPVVLVPRDADPEDEP